MKSKQDSELGKLTQAITSIEGIVAVIIFGSRARGDYDEHSDYDLLVVFQDDETMWRNRRELYKKVGNLGLFTQVLTRSVKELTENTEPTFLKTSSNKAQYYAFTTHSGLQPTPKTSHLWL